MNAVGNTAQFMEFTATVTDIQSVEVTVIDENNNPVGQPMEEQVSSPFTNEVVTINLGGQTGSTLRVVLVPIAYGTPSMTNVEIKACYEQVTTISSTTPPTSTSTFSTGTKTPSPTTSSSTASPPTTVSSTSSSTSVSTSTTTQSTSTTGTTTKTTTATGSTTQSFTGTATQTVSTSASSAYSSTSPSSTTVGTGATMGKTTTLSTLSQGSTTTVKPTVPTRPTVSTSTSTESTSAETTPSTTSTTTQTTKTVTTPTVSTYPSETMTLTTVVSTTTSPSTTSYSTTTGTTPTIPPTTTPCDRTYIQMRENLQNIEVTIVGESNRYAGSAVTSKLALEDDTEETIIADIIEVEEPNNPVFSVTFTTDYVIRAVVVLETAAGIPSGDQQVRDLQGLEGESVETNFNGAEGSKLRITLFKAPYTPKKMQISKLKIEACFKSTACELTTVTNDNAEDFVSVTDINGNAVGQIFTTGDLTGVPRSANGDITLTLALNGATLFTMPVSYTEVSFKLIYMTFTIFDSEGHPNDATGMDIHFDGIFKDMDTLIIVITPKGYQPKFSIDGFVGCMESKETTPAVTTTSVETTSASSTFTVTYPTGTSSSNPPTTTTPCVHTLIATGLNEQNVEITIPGEPITYGKKAVSGTLQLASDTTETVIIKLTETLETNNPMFSLSFKANNVMHVEVVLKTDTGAISGGPQTRNLQGNNDDVVFNFNGAVGHTFEIKLTKASYSTGKMEISEMKIEACFESTACIFTPTVTNTNYEDYVSVTDNDGDVVNSVFTSGDMTEVSRKSDGSIPLIFNFNKATLYTVSLSYSGASLEVKYGNFQFELPFSAGLFTTTVHFDGKIKDIDTLTIVVKPGAGEYNPTFKINEIEGCMGVRETTVVTTTPTTVTPSTSTSVPTETTTPFVTTTSATTISISTEVSTESTTSGTPTTSVSVTSTVPSVTTPSTSLTTTTSSLPTTTITITPTTTKTTSSATTTIMSTTTLGNRQCEVSSVSLQSQIGYQDYVENDNFIGYYLEDGVQVKVSPQDVIEEGEIVHFYCQNCTCDAVGQWACTEKAEPCTCSYFAWSEWTNCNKDCGSGTRSRTKKLIPGLYNCEDEKSEVESCYVKPCVTTTTEQPWSTWTPCNAADCETGTQTRTRCESTDINCREERTCSKNNTSCYCEDGKEFKSVCDYACNNTCKAYRTAECDESEDCENMACICAEGTTEHNGQCIEFKNCPCFDDDGTPMIQNTTKKYHDTCKECTCTEYGMDCKPLEECCVRNPWSEWSECYNNRMCGEGTRTRHSKVIYGSGPQCQDDEEVESCVLPTPCGQCTYGGKVYNDNDVVEENVELCIKKVCTNGTVTDEVIQGVDGGFSEWLNWGACSATTMQCTGTRERRRMCNNPVPKCGNPCDGDYNDIEECNSTICCAVTQWSTWNECSSDCGGGTKERTRDLLVPSDAPFCSQQLNETEACNTQSCETNCTVGEWTDWTPCSVTCGPGTKSRTREITSDIKEDCPHLNETADCYPQDCVCDQLHETWTNNSGCERSCENRYANNQCTGPPACECEVTYVRNEDGECVKEHTCNDCKLANNTTVEEGAVFINPLDKCSECRCEAGTVTCDSKCKQDVQCYEGEIKVLDDDGCCFVCKKDTCKMHTMTKTLSNIQFKEYTNCTTKAPVTYNYCSGGCGDSSHFPAGLGIPKECKCCISKDVRKHEIEIECIDPAYPTAVDVQLLTIMEPITCKCDTSPCQPLS